METDTSDIFETPLIVINLGVRQFAESLAAQGIDVIHIEWTPPAGGDEDMMALLDELL